MEQLLSADIAKVPAIIADIDRYRTWANPRLREQLALAAHDSRQNLQIRLALLAVEPSQKDYLYHRLLEADPREMAVLRDVLSSYRGELRDKLWRAVEQPRQGHEQQSLRAAYALADYDPDNPRWDQANGRVVNDLMLASVNPVFLGIWLEGLRPVRTRLLAPLSAVFRERAAKRAAERILAANILADYAADQPSLLADLLMDADDIQFGVLFRQGPGPWRAWAEPIACRIGRQVACGCPARSQGDAGQAAGERGANPQSIVQRWDAEPDVTIQRALVLSLGTFKPDQLPLAQRAALLAKLLDVYRVDPDPGLHGAVEWLLRQWDQQDQLKVIDEQLRQSKERRLEGIKQELARENGKAKPRWFVNGQGQTMVVLPPMEFTMGSPPSEAGRDRGTEGKGERQHKKLIARTFAIAAKAM